MIFLSDFADLGLILPLAALVALSLAAVGRHRQALAWSLAVAGTLGTMLLLKISAFAFLGPHATATVGLANPSGHTAAGVVVYAGLLALLGERFAPRVPAALLWGTVFGLLFGLSRVALRRHTLEEVLAGAAVGLVGAIALAKAAGPWPSATPVLGHAVVAAVALAAVLAFHGNRLDAETQLHWIAAEVRSAIGS